MSETVLVELVCDRENHKDTMYGTDIVWSKRGAIRRVPASAWVRMKIHADVYKLVGERAPDVLTLAKAEVEQAAAAGVDKVVVIAQNVPQDPTPWTVERVETASNEELHEAAAKLGRPLHPRLKDPEKVRKAFMEVVAQAVQAAEAAAAAAAGEPS